MENNGQRTYNGKIMTRPELVLAALASGESYRYTPVQVQKLLFLIDRQIPALVDGPYFNFEPYHYGPFDRAVYEELEHLARLGFANIDKADSLRAYTLTPEGIAKGKDVLEMVPAQAHDFIVRVCTFVRAQTFSSLVSAIYKAFPDMRVNSVFQH